MPVTKELTITMADNPGTLGTLCRALADGGVNIVALQGFPGGSGDGNSTVRLVVDNPVKAVTITQGQGLNVTQNNVVQVRVPHRPGALAGAAQDLGHNGVNINYIYGGVEPTTNAPVLIFGVTDTAAALSILETTTRKATA